MTQPLKEPNKTPENGRLIELPAPTSHPLYFALGVTLLFAGLVTDPIVSAVGGALSVFGVIGWWRDVLPTEREIGIAVSEPVRDVAAAAPRELLAAGSERHRVMQFRRSL